MCGIAALICPDGSQARQWLTPMLAQIKHRGPDGDGIETFKNISGSAWARSDDGLGHLGLGHVRLSIVDLSTAGHQPMPYQAQRYWISYNGEIYNYQTLRDELATLGHNFNSHSDTEVLLAAYAQWGRDCLHRLNGIFAFVLVDTHTGRVFAARDRFGVKPLYYWRSPDGFFAVASEIKQFAVLPGWRAVVNPQRAYDFLNWGLTDHTHETMYADVLQLQGGQLFEGSASALARDGAKPETWYQLQPSSESAHFDLPEAALRFGQLLDDSVRLQLLADVPVGSCLSGGLDSSSIVCLAAEQLGGSKKPKQHTFSARASVQNYDEGKFIQQVVELTQVQAHEVTPGLDGLFDVLPVLTWHQDEPFGSTSIYAQWHVFKLASESGIKVVLDGQGADELLGGYHNFFGTRLSGLLKNGNFVAFKNELAGLQKHHGYNKSYAISRIADVMLPNAVRQVLRRLAMKPTEDASSWLNTNVLAFEPCDPFEIAGARTSSISQLSHAQILKTNLPMLLHSEDRNSMAHGIEARVPFLDHRLVEFALGLKDENKIDEGITKRVLRTAMRGKVPGEIIDRMDKLGFVTPEEIWMLKKAPGLFREKLNTAIEASRGILKPELLTEFDQMLTGRRPFSFKTWRMISFGEWMKRFDMQIQ